MTSYTGTDNGDNIGYGTIDNDADVYGLEGNDTIYACFAGLNDVDGGPGNDTIYFQGSQITGGTIFGGSGNDFISALATNGYGSGNTFSNTTSINYLDGGTGNDTLIGAGAADTLVGNGADSMVGSTVTNATNEFYDLWDGDATMVGGAAAFNYFHASGGGDKLYGGNSGDDYWVSHYGSDTVNAGSGNDYIYDASFGSNSINLGGGNDTVYAVGSNNDTIIGGSGNKLIFFGSANSGGTQVTGGSGNDTINGAAGQGVEYIAPGTGSGTNIAIGNDYSTHIYGNNSNGTLYMRGGVGQDEMVGGHGANFFIGGGGGDFATGGGAANAFEFNSAGEGNLHINNFNTATDVISVYAGGFGSLTAGETLTAGFNLLNGTTTAVAATPTFEVSGGALYFDPDGTGSAGRTLLASLGTTNALSANNFRVSGTKF